MNNHWILPTRGEPLAAVQDFLRRIYARARLDGMLVPLAVGGEAGVVCELVTDRDRLQLADPFAPLAPANSVWALEEVIRRRPLDRLGAVLRPCESRALQECLRHAGLTVDRLLTIGVDCLGTYSPDDYAARFRVPGARRSLADETLRFTRQGGIAPYRYRPACQACPDPSPAATDVTIELLGLTVYETILVGAREAEIAEQLGFDEITAGRAPRTLVAQRDRMHTVLLGRHQRAEARLGLRLPQALPVDPAGVAALFAGCAPCEACLEACPIAMADGLPARAAELTAHDILHWLASCAECGQCEDACPQHRPLALLFHRVREQAGLAGAGLLGGGSSQALAVVR